MAEIASTRGDYAQALNYANQSLSSNTTSIRALALRAAMLRHLDATTEALATIKALHQIDPLNVQAMAEEALLRYSNNEVWFTLSKNIDKHPATELQYAGDYLNAGLWEDGFNLLNAGDDPNRSPLIDYYLAYFAQKLNQPQKSADFLARAVKASPDYVFPSKWK